jgi:galactose-1-phosphate uridylyltransferase
MDQNPIKLQPVSQQSQFLNPFNNFEPTTLTVDVREDPLTGQVSRIVPFRVKKLPPTDYEPLIKRSVEMGCAFCPEAVDNRAAKFVPGFADPEGRIRQGRAVVFPNAFPYTRHSAVIALGRRHFRSLAQMDPELLADGFTAAQRYFEAVVRTEPQYIYCSVNMNYMPLAGAGQIHPHFQAVALDRPTRHQRQMIDGLNRYRDRYQRSFWPDLIAREKEIGQRLITQTGPVTWLSPFAPQGVYDLMALVEPGGQPAQLSPPALEALCTSLSQVLACLDDQNIPAMNLALHLIPDPDCWIQLRLLPRLNIPPVDISDINYFQRLHDEALTFLPPETAAAQIREWFNNQEAGKPPAAEN